MLAKSSRSHQSDADLVADIVQGAGRERAEAELYARYQRRAYLYGLKHLRDADAAWDLAQEALGTLLKKIHARELDDPERLGSFLLGICRMLALGERRTQARRKKLLAVYAEPERVSAPPSVDAPDVARLTRCLDALADRERTVLVLSYYAELDAGSIGAELGTSAGNVRVLRHRAFERLQACVHGAGGPSA
jgi:RNA polymerase sigma-70 factor, ECF subfamily